MTPNYLVRGVVKRPPRKGKERVMKSDKRNDTKSPAEQVLDTFIEAVLANVPANAVIHVGGVPYTQPELVRKADLERTFLKNARAAKEVYRKVTAELHRERPEIHGFLKEAKIGMKAFLGSDNPDIEKYGFHLDRNPEMSAESKAKSVEKARQTRAELHPDA
jgi:hypothetical protein